MALTHEERIITRARKSTDAATDHLHSAIEEMIKTHEFLPTLGALCNETAYMLRALQCEGHATEDVLDMIKVIVKTGRGSVGFAAATQEH